MEKERTDQQRSRWAGFVDGMLLGWDAMLFGEGDTVSCLGEQERRVCVCVYERRSAVPRLVRWEEVTGSGKQQQALAFGCTARSLYRLDDCPRLFELLQGQPVRLAATQYQVFALTM